MPSHQARFNSNTMLNTMLRTIFILALRSLPVLASPFVSTDHVLQNRATGNDNPSTSNVPIRIWLPIVAFAFLLVSLATLTWTRVWIKKLLHSLRADPGVAPNTTQPPAQGTTVLTAEQLAGSLNRNSGASGNGTVGRTRRSRRARRTPSQISTASLPAYNKEPGDQELVIFRGPQDMEDMPTAVVMPSVEEDAESSSHSRHNSQGSTYDPMPSTPNDMPLLQGNENSADMVPQNTMPQGIDNPSRRSLDTMDSADTSSLMRVSTGSPAPGVDERGEAPPYFEVVDSVAERTDNNLAAIPGTPNPPHGQPPPRRSGFRSLLHAINPTHARASAAAAQETTSNNVNRLNHTQSRSITSSASGRPEGLELTQSHSSHHRQSGSSSFFNASGFRSASRPKSANSANHANPLNSPSTISLNSISAPLPHTLVRTEFTYPKSGPTPEQLKLISSRESFARFGMPYGAAAIAYASSSRQDLEAPPPDFDTTLNTDTTPPRSTGPIGRSRLRVASDASDLSDSLPVREPTEQPPLPQNEPGSSNSASVQSSQPSSSLPSPPPSPPAAMDPLPTANPASPSATSLLPKTNLPPTAFKVPSIAPARSESRTTMNSTQSYATAAESPIPSSPGSVSNFPLGVSEPPTPTTPKLMGRVPEPSVVTKEISMTGPSQS